MKKFQIVLVLGTIITSLLTNHASAQLYAVNIYVENLSKFINLSSSAYTAEETGISKAVVNLAKANGRALKNFYSQFSGKETSSATWFEGEKVTTASFSSQDKNTTVYYD